MQASWLHCTAPPPGKMNIFYRGRKYKKHEGYKRMHYLLCIWRQGTSVQAKIMKGVAVRSAWIASGLEQQNIFLDVEDHDWNQLGTGTWHLISPITGLGGTRNQTCFPFPSNKWSPAVYSILMARPLLDNGQFSIISFFILSQGPEHTACCLCCLTGPLMQG